jgi:hypothetical protein
MTIPLVEVPADAYRSRAGNAPKPLGHDATARGLHQHDPEMALWLATTAVNYFADISEYQQPFDSSYAYPVGMFRFFSGYRTDNNAAANWSYLDAALGKGAARIVLAYPVFVPGQLTAMLASLRNTFGATCPTNRLVVVPDMESGPGFAGPGDHSAEANDWVYALADYTGTGTDLARAHGYANNGDFASCWPQIAPRISKHTAAYNAVNPGTFAWQYQGGNPAYPAPAGAPRAYAPFGTYVDGNVIYRTLDDIEQLLGITTPEEPMSIILMTQGGGYYVTDEAFSSRTPIEDGAALTFLTTVVKAVVPNPMLSDAEINAIPIAGTTDALLAQLITAVKGIQPGTVNITGPTAQQIAQELGAAITKGAS